MLTYQSGSVLLITDYEKLQAIIISRCGYLLPSLGKTTLATLATRIFSVEKGSYNLGTRQKQRHL